MENKRNDKIWIFNAGNTFTGNPKWLFIYINKYRKDIKSYWFCDSKETTKHIRSLGYKAYIYKSKIGRAIEKKAGVFVVEMVKEHIPIRMQDVKILNLWHGVGCKSIERKVNFGFLNERIAKKYITYNTIFKNNQLFLVTSPLMEKHFKEQCGIDDDKVIRGGYPRCMYNIYKEKISTFNHDILKEKGLPQNTKIAVYTPTYRDGNQKDFFITAIPDMERLIEKLKEKNMLLIFKMHPLMEQDYHYCQLKEYYKDCPNLLFWDNSKDIYEIFYKIDLAIVDYSSIFYDMLAAGVPHFVRYFFDYDNENNLRDFVFDVEEMTCGKMCKTFDELINVFDNYEEQDEEKKKKIYDLFWSYTNENSFEEIINQTIKFKNEDRQLPELHSYDIFDTLIGRKTLLPEGIFYYVKTKMEKSKIEFPEYLIKSYPRSRMDAEKNVREYYKKSQEQRGTEQIEIAFEDIFHRMADLYELNEEQINSLMKWELEAEYENSIPFPEKIDELKEHIANGDKVILISDMYLSKEFITNLLIKADPILAELPLFLSSDYGVQKSTNKLFLKAFYNMDYKFSKWIHHGDNVNSDEKMPKKLAIATCRHKIPVPNGYEKGLINSLRNYDAFLVANNITRFRYENKGIKDCYAHSYVSLYWVPYINWTIRDAQKRGIKCLYFISRDGYHLKRIADKIIETKNIPIKTKYIYGSRKAWRIPSFIDAIDDEFFGPFGNFSVVDSYEKLLKALDIDNTEKFNEIFPELNNYVNAKKITKQEKEKLVGIIKNSIKYEEYLLTRAKERRKIVNQYLKQEINMKERFAFVEYWGRGYTQDCLVRLLHNIAKENIDVPFYYARSIYPTIGSSIRYNFTSNPASLIFVETIFANLPYESIEGYTYDTTNNVVPIIKERQNDKNLHEALENYLVQFAEEYSKMNFLDEDRIDRELFNFSLKWCNSTPNDRYIYESIGDLKDSVEMYANEKTFAPPITFYDALDSLRGHAFKNKTRSLKMSLARTSPFMKKLYFGKKSVKDKLKKHSPKKIVKKIVKKIKRK